MNAGDMNEQCHEDPFCILPPHVGVPAHMDCTGYTYEHDDTDRTAMVYDDDGDAVGKAY